MSLSQQEKSQNRRTAWVLASVAVAFFAGVVAKFWLFGG
jgi:hypothetical protein